MASISVAIPENIEIGTTLQSGARRRRIDLPSKLSGLGPAYAAPAKTLRDASCDGAFLNTLPAADLAATLADAGLGPVQARRARHALGLSPCSKTS